MKRVLLIVFTLIGYVSIAQSIISAEYFFDSDPGIGSGTTLVVDSNTGQLTQTFAIPTGSLTEGFHSLYVRTLNNKGNWSLFDRQNFYLKSFDSFNILAAEYFFNTDPGVGNGTGLVVDANEGQLIQTFTIPTTGLAEGFHSFYLRTKSTSGKWSLYDKQVFYIRNFDFTPDKVVGAEYFIDSDPGIGNATSIAFANTSQTTQALSIDTTNLTDGDHMFYVRVQDENGDWSIYDSALFTVDSALGVADSLFKNTSIYPNPFINNVEIFSTQNLKIEQAIVYDFVGKTVYNSALNSKKMDLSFLAKGVYILELKANGNKASFKIVKK